MSFPNHPAILRFQLDVDGGKIEMPSASRILSVAPGRSESGYPMDVWAYCWPSMMTTQVTFNVFGTGHPVTPAATRKFVGTCVMPLDGLVWHVFYDPTGLK